MTGDRSIEDLLGEALRRHRHGLMRPLWADMPDGELKQRWRAAGMALLSADDQRHHAEGLLREAAMRTLSVRSAVEVLRNGWLASAEHAALFATDDPQTPEQWRAFGAAEAQRACAGELDPEKDTIFEPSELAKARGEVERLASVTAILAKALNEFSCDCGKDCLEGRRNGLAVPQSMCAHNRARVVLEQIDARQLEPAEPRS